MFSSSCNAIWVGDRLDQLEIGKLLCAASFLNTAAAMCYLYVGMVLRNEAGGSWNKIVIAPTSQNFILYIMPPIVTFQLSPLNHK
jgi:hypothetical protein